MVERFKAGPESQVKIEPMGILEARRMLYDATAKGWPANRASSLIRMIQQETPDMYSSALEPGTPEFERYYELRRAGKTRTEAFGIVLQEIDVDDPRTALTAREVQEGREAVIVPGDRQSFINSNTPVKMDSPKGDKRSAAIASVDYPTRREAMQDDLERIARREAATEAAKKASSEVRASQKKSSIERHRSSSSKTSKVKSRESEVDIPEDWRSQSAAEVRTLAEQISGDKPSNREEAENVIENELSKRSG